MIRTHRCAGENERIGYCQQDPQMGALTCGKKQNQCSKEFDKCATSADCCDPKLECVNEICTLVVPQ